MKRSIDDVVGEIRRVNATIAAVDHELEPLQERVRMLVASRRELGDRWFALRRELDEQLQIV